MPKQTDYATTAGELGEMRQGMKVQQWSREIQETIGWRGGSKG